MAHHWRPQEVAEANLNITSAMKTVQTKSMCYFPAPQIEKTAAHRLLDATGAFDDTFAEEL
ncbi:hypothetical protein [Rhizobium sp. BR 249]|uniref:hypothetical protein n=1 Tax=Rhizobium sp. BR 249 TaxID=3040011 RepID=UPI0039BFBE1A